MPSVLAKIKPDVIAVDNVILFPAIKQFGVPWVRIISCSENEIEDPAIPPHLSGMSENDTVGHSAFRAKFEEIIAPIHADFNDFLTSCGEDSYKLGEFFEASPHMNMMLYPEPLTYTRDTPLDPARFQYLEGCVREDDAYTVPKFGVNNDGPLLYISFGSLGAGDTDLLKRLITLVGKSRYRALVNVGDYKNDYTDIPPNVIIEDWYPQPSVIPQVDAVIHHGGNNSFTECLYFGKPAIIMPYVWDGHDNAMRVQETGYGLRSDRYEWTDEEMIAKIEACLTNAEMAEKLVKISKHMQSCEGPKKAAKLLAGLVE